MKDVGTLITRSERAQQKVATFAVDGTVRFASARDRAAFAEELSAAVASLVSRYHDEQSPGGRDHRVVIALHPAITRNEQGS